MDCIYIFIFYFGVGLIVLFSLPVSLPFCLPFFHGGSYGLERLVAMEVRRWGSPTHFVNIDRYVNLHINFSISETTIKTKNTISAISALFDFLLHP